MPGGGGGGRKRVGYIYVFDITGSMHRRIVLHNTVDYLCPDGLHSPFIFADKFRVCRRVCTGRTNTAKSLSLPLKRRKVLPPLHCSLPELRYVMILMDCRR
jgi:hypothetical protein